EAHRSGRFRWRGRRHRPGSLGGDLGEMVDHIVAEAMDGAFSEFGASSNRRPWAHSAQPAQADQHFDLAAGADRTMKLEIELNHGSLVLVPSADAQGVHFSYRGPEQLTPLVSFENHVLQIEQPRRSVNFSFGRGMDAPRIEVQVPTGVTLTGSAELMNGLFNMEGLSARDLKVESLNGAFRVSARSLDHCSFETRNGAMEVVAGEAQRVSMETLNGKLSLAGVLQGCSLETVNGRIFAEALPGSRGKLSAETVRGAITVHIPKTLGYALKAEAGVGSVNLDVHGTIRHQSGGTVGREVTMADGDEALQIKLETAFGSITVEDSRA
ncbi:MAG: DUF4097 family beta strand repeat-containing protein, partial [Sulfobacillus sp.]